MREKALHIWVLPYLRQQLSRIFGKNNKTEERHIILSICDHFDFGSGGDVQAGEETIFDQWEKYFPPLAERHYDSCGHKLSHTWFYPTHYHRRDYLQRLVALCTSGYGEIEMHLHHDHTPPFPDTEETLRIKIRNCIDAYAQHGVFTLPDGKRTFAFIHGDWALDNSRGGKFCGVNNEIRILAEEGCYADFTFPSLHESQPKKINSIYYVTDDPDRPKSYDSGCDVRVGGEASGDLMLIQGPLGLRTKKKFRIPIFPAIESAELQGASVPSLARARAWVSADVHVKGRPEWIFVKLHTHGAIKNNFPHNFGSMADDFFTELEKTYANPSDGLLHYVSAREMYNIIKAAEAGEVGNPASFRDYAIPRYIYLDK